MERSPRILRPAALVTAACALALAFSPGNDLEHMRPLQTGHIEDVFEDMFFERSTHTDRMGPRTALDDSTSLEESRQIDELPLQCAWQLGQSALVTQLVLQTPRTDRAYQS